MRQHPATHIDPSCSPIIKSIPSHKIRATTCCSCHPFSSHKEPTPPPVPTVLPSKHPRRPSCSYCSPVIKIPRNPPVPTVLPSKHPRVTLLFTRQSTNNYYINPYVSCINQRSKNQLSGSFFSPYTHRKIRSQTVFISHKSHTPATTTGILRRTTNNS